MPSTLPAPERPALPTRTATLAARVLRDLAIGGAVCAVVAVFLSVAFNNPFLRTLVFSLCIGLSCLGLIDGGRRLVANGLRRRQPDDPALHAGWPGWRWTLPIILAGSWGGVQIGYPLAAWLLGIAVPRPGLDQPRVLFINLAVSVVAAGFMVYWSWSRARMAASEARAQAAQRAAAETQLKLLEQVLYFEAADKYLRVVTAEREHLIRLSLKELLPQLDPQQFWQVHRGTIVRADAIASALREASGKVTLTLRGQADKLSASRLYAHLFRGM